MPIRIADDLRKLYPEIDRVVRISHRESKIRKSDLVFKEKLTFVDPEFLKVFSFPILDGNNSNPLDGLNSIILSNEMAEKYFPGDNPIGKTLEVTISSKKEDFIVTAVIDNLKDRSSFIFDFLSPYIAFIARSSESMLTKYTAHNPVTFIKLKPNTDVDVLGEKFLNIDDFIDQKLQEGQMKKYFIQDLSKVHFSMELNNRHLRTSSPTSLYILIGLGLIVLLIACINFTTLSIGLSTTRSKEVGVRKVVGAVNSQLKKQYLGEAIFSSFLALLGGLFFAVLFLPVFNNLSGKNLSFSLELKLLITLMLLTLFVGLISGIYPASILSRLNPVKILKGSSEKGRKSFFSKILVVVQFSLSIFLIIVTVVFHKQLDFLNKKNLEFDHERLIELELSATNDNAEQLFKRVKNELMRHNRIIDIAGTSSDYGMSWGNVYWTRLGFKDADNEQKYFHFNQVSYDYLQTMGIELIKGRNFSEKFVSDRTGAVIINEEAVKYFKLEDPLNKRIEGLCKPDTKVIGVIKNFHYASLHEEIEPLVLALSGEGIDVENFNDYYGFWPHHLNYAVIKISSGEIRPVLEYIESKWTQISPFSPYEIKFIVETIQRQYETEKRWRSIVNYSSILAVFIACMGLFGLSLISASSRIKEVGIRKVLGASTLKIVTLISKDLILLVAAANILSWPIAYYVSRLWLQNFAYKTNLSLSIFAISGFCTLFVAVITISFQIMKAASSNPVESLRHQ
jgi:putative ABC transport system permease protein